MYFSCLFGELHDAAQLQEYSHGKKAFAFLATIVRHFYLVHKYKSCFVCDCIDLTNLLNLLVCGFEAWCGIAVPALFFVALVVDEVLVVVWDDAFAVVVEGDVFLVDEHFVVIVVVN